MIIFLFASYATVWHQTSMSMIMSEDDLSTPHDKCRNLLLAIIHRAVLDYLDDTHDRAVASVYAREPSNRAKAAASLFEEAQDDRSEPFTFRWIAEHLSDAPEAMMAGIRSRLLKAPKRKEVRETQGLYANRFHKGVGANWRTAG
jgi:hypothetical protein